MEEEKIFATRLGPEGHKPVLMNPQLLVDSVPALIHTGLPDGYLDFFNQTWLNYVGASLEDLAGWKWTARIHPEDAAAMVEKWRASIATGEPFEHEARVRRADGEYRWMIHRKVALRDERGNILKWYGTSIDIEDRKRAEEAVRRSEAYMAEAQMISHTASFVYSPGSRKTLYWSEELFRIFELDPRHGIPDYDESRRLVHPDDLDRVSESCLQGFREKADFTQDFRLLLRDGIVKHLHVIWHPALDKAGEVVEYFGTAMDVTERKHAEEALRRSEKELRSVIETVPAMVWSALPDGSNVWMNKHWTDYTGISATGLGWQAAVHPDDLGRHLDAFYESSAKGMPFQDEVRFRRADGEYRRFIVAGVPLRDEEGNILKWYGVLHDIEDRKRAEDSLQKAFDEIKKLKDQLYRENIALREEIDRASMFEEIVGSSPPLKAVLARVAKVAPTDSTVFITGETGTGKELVARAIHRRSKHSSRAFVGVNCNAIPASLIASELFGHEKGAFTGAHQRRLGRFELAEGGTIFLDEIGELPPETQVALLRVLQEHEFERVGGNKAIRANVRVIAATSRDLQVAIEAGIFRRDLFYRLNVFPIEIPPLRERKEDIPLLVEYFIDRYAGKAGKKIRGINNRTLDLFRSYPWPGNIRELQNVIERSVILCDTENFSVDERWLLRECRQTQPASQPLSHELVTHEKEMIEAALAESRGRVAGPLGAAAKLGIPPTTLESKIRSLKINKHRFKPA
ncbi:MAG TPA: sigma 54-interacting transcriptional regulator [Nitrospirota bacterium]|nr:sigma 54-interacting transcriptional regulator [Nitrospirota bacterium]